MGFDECGPVHSAPEGCTRSELDLDLDAGGDFEAHQCLNGLLGGVEGTNEIQKMVISKDITKEMLPKKA